MTKIKKLWGKRGRMPWWHLSYWYGESCKNINDDKNEIYDEEIVAECLYETCPDDMEEGVNDRKDDKNEKIMGKKRQNSQMTLSLLIRRKV